MSDALWVHSEAMQILDRTLMWVMLPLSVVLTVCMCIGYWRQSERLFWRKWRRWGASLAFGAAAAALLVVLVHLAKGEKATIEEGDRTLLLGAFSAAGLIWYFARYKFRSWRGDE
jgi:peptidoglycan biosynthesis protein MviN/MurJ (putative lipid II flippase)